MRRIISIIILCVGILASADAQTYTQRIQTKVAGQGTVTISQDTVIDRLVNSAQLGVRASSATRDRDDEPRTSTHPTNTTKQNTTKPNTVATTPSADSKETTVDNSPKMIRGGVKISGYRVQAFAGGNSRKDRQKAERIGNDIKSAFSDVPVYVHFYSPRWICRVGNYRTYEEAHQMLISLRSMGYSQATIVKGKITVPSY